MKSRGRCLDCGAFVCTVLVGPEGPEREGRETESRRCSCPRVYLLSSSSCSSRSASGPLWVTCLLSVSRDSISSRRRERSAKVRSETRRRERTEKRVCFLHFLVLHVPLPCGDHRSVKAVQCVVSTVRPELSATADARAHTVSRTRAAHQSTTRQDRHVDTVEVESAPPRPARRRAASGGAKSREYMKESAGPAKPQAHTPLGSGTCPSSVQAACWRW